MSTYFATFPAGTFEIIAKHLSGFNPSQLKVIEHDDSSVLFESQLTPERLIEIRYFTNVYLVANKPSDLPKWLIKGKYFSLAFLKGGEPEAMSEGEKTKWQAGLVRELKLEPNTHLALNNFYVIERSSGSKMFTLRLARAKFKREKLAAGELRPELAHILCLLAGVKAKQVALDMFAGYGAIPYEMVRGFGVKRAIAANDHILAGRHEHPNIEWQGADAANLRFLSNKSVDCIVTDPPWGDYDTKTDVSALYDGFARESARVLKPYGVLVVLSGYNNARQHFENVEGLRLMGEWDVLVSGKKAKIFKLQKRS